MYASIVVDVKSSNTDVIYTYHIPSHLESFVYVGSRVIVPFAVRQVTGYVVEIIDECEYQGVIKDIVEVLDYDKELTEEQVLLAKTIATETKSLLTSCLGLMYPSFLKAKYRKYVTVKNFADLDANVAMIFNAKGKIAINDKLLQEYPKIKTEIKKGNLELSYDVYSYGKRKYTKLYFYDDKYDVLLKDYKGSELKMRIIKFVKEAINGCTIDTIKEHIHCSNYVVRSIEKDGYIFSKNVLLNEKPAQAKPQKILKYINYNFDQASLKEKYDTLSSKPFLLFSNDEKFKLDLYLSIATEMVNNNKKVLILTPTLITNFLVALHFKKYLSGYRIVTFSSDLSQAEYYDNYMEVKWNDYDIIITTKVGAFLPLNDLGLIIVVDEENNNYIGEYSPKYHAIEVMKNRAKYHNAKLVLSTSSPSMEAYYNYSRAKYSLLKYIVPNNNDVEIVDMHSQFYDENLIISKELQNRITNTLSNDNQVMLILNAKGYSTYLTCRNCGKILKCPKCKITMTYYQEKNETKCRYCGTKAESLYCDCGNNYTMLGIGLEKVKETIQKQISELEKIAGMTGEEAKQALIQSIEHEVKLETAVMIKTMEQNAKEEANKKAQSIIAGAIQKCAAEQVAEHTVSVVALPNDEMKGRIIGREGRNIKTLETLTGIDLIIDDTPEAVILSGFDPLRREVAKIALEKLIDDRKNSSSKNRRNG